MDDSIFFYADSCPLCEPTVAEIAPWYAERRLSLVVRKPTLGELRTPGFSYPALLLPPGFGKLKTNTLLVGSGIYKTLLTLWEGKRLNVS
jgi:hypothetical protein